MITITIEDDEDVVTLFNIMIELRQMFDCLEGECDHNDGCRGDEC